MANFWNEIGDFGNEILDTGGDVLTGIGNNFEASSIANMAKAERIAVENKLAVQNQIDAEARKKKNDELMKNVVYAVLLMLFVVLAFSLVMKYNKG